MKKLIIIIFLLTLNFATFGQQKVELDCQFKSLKLIGNLRAKIYNSQDSTTRIYATLYGIDAQRLKWKQSGDMLIVSLPSGLVEGDSYAELEVYSSGLNRLICEGATVECVDTLVGESIYVEALSSINSLLLKVDVTEFKLKAAASANIRVVGMASWAEIWANVGAKINCIEATFADCTVQAGENSEVIIRVSDNLEAKATAKASIFYIGSPTTTIKTSLGGGVTPIIPPSQN